MSIYDILELEYNTKDGKDAIKELLKNIAPISKYYKKDFPVNVLEKFIHQFCSKYTVFLRDIRFDHLSNESFDILTCILVNEADTVSYNIYGASIYEIYCKVCIIMWRIKSDCKKRV